MKLRNFAAGFALLATIETSVAQDRIDTLREDGLHEYHAGNFAAAEASYLQAAELAVSSGNKELEALTRNDLGNVEIGADRLDRAYENYSKALVIFRNIPGKHFETAATLRNLASVETGQAHFSEAKKYLAEARQILQLHPELTDSQLLTAEIQNSEGILLFQQGKLDKANVLFEQAMRTRAVAGVPEGLGDAQSLNNIGAIYLLKRKYTAAERAFLRSVDITIRALGPAHPDLTLTLVSLGETYTAMGRYSEADRQYERCLTILHSLNPPLYGRTIRTLGLEGFNQMKEGNDSSAALSFEEAIKVSRLADVDEPNLPGMLDIYADLLQKQGRLHDARDLRADANRMRLKTALTVRLKTSR